MDQTEKFLTRKNSTLLKEEYDFVIFSCDFCDQTCFLFVWNYQVN